MDEENDERFIYSLIFFGSHTSFFVFLQAYGGTKLVVVGGKRKVDLENIPYPEVRINHVLSDVYIFDIETSIWTMETATPIGYSSALCAISGDHLILYGGMSVVYNPHPDQYGSDFVANSTTSIYNMKTRTWVSMYTPS